MIAPRVNTELTQSMATREAMLREGAACGAVGREGSRHTRNQMPRYGAQSWCLSVPHWNNLGTSAAVHSRVFFHTFVWLYSPAVQPSRCFSRHTPSSATSSPEPNR